jgi:hypothetical protein
MAALGRSFKIGGVKGNISYLYKIPPYCSNRTFAPQFMGHLQLSELEGLVFNRVTKSQS